MPENNEGGGAESDWAAALFSAAGLDASALTPVEPVRIPAFFADTRRAWEGALPGNPGVRVRVESASHRGKLVSFDIDGPWSVRRVAVFR